MEWGQGAVSAAVVVVVVVVVVVMVMVVVAVRWNRGGVEREGVALACLGCWSCVGHSLPPCPSPVAVHPTHPCARRFIQMRDTVQEYVKIPKTSTPLTALGSGSLTIALSMMIPAPYLSWICVLCDRAVGCVGCVGGGTLMCE